MRKGSRKPVSDRFWSKVEKCADDECWLWLAGKDRDGYGQMGFVEDDGRRTTRRATAVSLELHGVVVPKGHMVLHSCDNPPCVNPRHLKVGTALDNNRDKLVKGRHKGAPKVSGRNLTLDDVLTIRSKVAHGAKASALAKQFGVSHKHINRICRGEQWKIIERQAA